MPGIVGIISPDIAQGSASAGVSNMMQTLLHHSWYRGAHEQLRGATLGVVNLGTAEAVHGVVLHNARYLLTFAGELYNELELRHLLASEQLTANATQAELVLQAFMHWGTAAFERLNGIFQIALWDAVREELLIGGDPAGLRPIYFAHDHQNFGFAPEVKALLPLPWVAREVDPQGIQCFLRHGFVMGERTFFRAIKTLPGGSFARWQRGRLQIERYWNVHFADHAQLDEREMQTRFVATWEDIMQRHTAASPALGTLLSGGLDSRLILAGCMARGKQVPVFTTGTPASDDVRLAHQLAQVSGSPSLYSPILPEKMVTGLARAVYLTDGMFNCFHANVRFLMPRLAEFVDVVFDGICPLDSFYNALEVPLRRMLGKAQPLEWLRQAVGQYDVKAFRVGAKNFNLLQAYATDEEDFLAAYEQKVRTRYAGSTALLDLFRFEERQQRLFSYGPALLRTAVEVRCPFFDKKMLELLPFMSPRHRSEDKPLHKHAIRKLAPGLAEVPWERTGLPLHAGALKTHVRLGAKFLSNRAAAFREKYFETTSRRTTRHSMLSYDDMLRGSEGLKKFVAEHLLAPAGKKAALFHHHHLQALLAHHEQHKGNHAEIIGRLLTVALWHRHFIERATSNESYEFAFAS